MSHHWLLITFSWFGSVSLQYINTGGPTANTVLDQLDPTLQYSPLVNYYHEPSDIDLEAPLNDDTVFIGEPRKRRTAEPKYGQNWLPNFLDQTTHLTDEDASLLGKENETEVEKKNFSPWGGKRGQSPFFEHTWTWKRAASVREPSMPKRVRFSPWGGKRSGQMVYKPGNKASKLIYSTSIPELTHIVSNYYPNGHQFNLARFHFVPGVDKRHPIKILAVTTDSENFKDALPFQAILENLPKLFKPGHPYTDLHIKKDGKRKVKFSAWGGKRSPPIIGPIWTPATQDLKEATLNTILFIRKNENGLRKL